MHGPLTFCSSNRCLGYDKHLDSFLKYTRTEVEIDIILKNATYVVRDLDTWKVLAKYEQKYEWNPNLLTLKLTASSSIAVFKNS